MPHNACPLPNPHTSDDATIALLLRAHRIAIVGLSDDPSRASYHVAQYLLSQGNEILPVNPNHPTVLGLKSYATLEEAPGHLDLVNIFRRPEFTPAIVQSAITLHAGGVWLQSGITNPEAQRLASAAHLPFVQDRCLMVEHARRRPYNDTPSDR